LTTRSLNFLSAVNDASVRRPDEHPHDGDRVQSIIAATAFAFAVTVE